MSVFFLSSCAGPEAKREQIPGLVDSVLNDDRAQAQALAARYRSGSAPWGQVWRMANAFQAWATAKEPAAALTALDHLAVLILPVSEPLAQKLLQNRKDARVRFRDEQVPLLLDAVAADDKPAALRAFGVLKEIDGLKDLGDLPPAVVTWAKALPPGQDLSALSQLIKAAAPLSAAADSMKGLMNRRKILREKLLADEARYKDDAAAAASELRCGAAQAANQTVLDIAKATKTPPELALRLTDCATAYADVGAELAHGDYAKAYRRWQAFRVKSGAAAEDPSVGRAAKTFAAEMQATVDELKSPNGLSRAEAPTRVFLEGLPIMLSWVPALNSGLRHEQSRLDRAAEKAPDWETLAGVAPALCWVEHLVAGAAPDRAKLSKKIAAARGGAYDESRDYWSTQESGSSQAGKTVAAAVRRLAATDLAHQADQLTQENKLSAATAVLKKAAELDKDASAVGQARKRLAEGYKSARADGLQKLRAAKDAETAAAAFKRVDALDGETSGPGLKLDVSTRAAISAALEVYAQGQQRQAYKTVRPLVSDGVDYAQAAVERLRFFTKEWGLKRAASLQANGNNQPALEILAELQALDPKDQQFVGLIAAARKAARDRRLTAFGALVKDGKPAYAYVLSEIDGNMSGEDRAAFLRDRQEEISALKDKLKLVGVVDSDDAFSGLIGQDILGATPGVELVDAPPQPAPAQTFKITLKTERLDLGRKTLVRSEKGSASYVASHHLEHNPRLDACRNEVTQLSSRLDGMRSRKQSFKQTHDDCIRLANSYKNPFQAGLAAAGCEGGYILAIGGDIDATQSQLDRDGADCDRTPEKISVPTYANAPYWIAIWAVKTSADVSVSASASDAPRPFFREIEHGAYAPDEGRQIHGNSDYNIPEVAMSLPDPDQRAETLAAYLAPKVKEALLAQLRSRWNTVRKTAAKQKNALAQREQLSRLVVISELFEGADADLAKLSESIKSDAQGWLGPVEDEPEERPEQAAVSAAAKPQRARKKGSGTKQGRQP